MLCFYFFSKRNNRDLHRKQITRTLIWNRRTRHVSGLAPPPVQKPLVLLATSWSKHFDFLVSNVFPSVSCIFPFSSIVFLIAILGLRWQHRFQASQDVHRQPTKPRMWSHAAKMPKIHIHCKIISMPILFE